MSPAIKYSLALAAFLTGVLAHTQDIIKRNDVLRDIPYSTNLPYIKPFALHSSSFKVPYCSVSDDIYQLKVFTDFQLTKYVEKDNIMDERLYLKMLIPESAACLHAIEAYVPEFFEDELVIINDGVVLDRLRAVRIRVTPLTLARDYEITEKWEIITYSIIPESDSPIDMLEFGLDTSNSIIARLRTDVYEIRHDKFILKDSTMSEERVIRAGDFSRDTKLKDMFDVR